MKKEKYPYSFGEEQFSSIKSRKTNDEKGKKELISMEK